MTLGCFLCNSPEHWAEACWTRSPPTSKDHHEARIATYRDWCTIQWRITPRQKRELIENENDMWRKATERKTA